MATFINQQSLLQAFVTKLAYSSDLKIVKEKYNIIQSDTTYMLCLVINIFFFLKLYKIGCIPLNYKLSF